MMNAGGTVYKWYTGYPGVEYINYKRMRLLNNFMKRFGVVFFLIFLLSCVRHTAPATITVNTKENNTDLFKTLKIYKILRLTGTDVIGNIQKAIYAGNNLYLFDKPGNKIFCYTDGGDFLFTLDRRGKGPQEYVRIQNFFMDEKGGEIVILTGEDECVIYSGTTGEFLRREKAGAEGGMVLDGCRNSGLQMLHIMGPEFNLLLSDSDSAELHLPYNMTRDMAFSYKAFGQNKKEVIFAHGYDNNIYNIPGIDEVNIKYSVDFLEKNIPVSVFEDVSGVKFSDLFETKEVATKPDYLLEDEKYLFFSYWLFTPGEEEVKTNYVFYRKGDARSFNIKGNAGLLPIMDKKGNQYISVINAADVVNHNSLYGDNEVVAGIEENDNPVVIFWGI